MKSFFLSIFISIVLFSFFAVSSVLSDPSDKVAIGVYTNGDITSAQGSPLLAGKFGANFIAKNSNFTLTQAQILNDIIKSGNEIDDQSGELVIKINGVAYSSTGYGLITAEPVDQAGTNFVPSNSISVNCTNTINSGVIRIAFRGRFLGQALSEMQGSASSISNVNNTTFDTDNKANFRLIGDVIEQSVTNVDDSGLYEGGIVVTVTVL